jgi:MipA family protein
LRILTLTAFGVLFASPALAQEKPREQAPDSFTAGVGTANIPRYEGADDNVFVPAVAVRGSISGIAFSTLGTALFVDLVPSYTGPGTKLVAGPMAHVTLNRTSAKRTRAQQIVALGKVDTAIEVGGHLGISRTGVITSDFDTFTLDVAVSHDVTGTHGSLIVTPSINYGTPLSEKIYVGLSVAANHVGGGYAKTYFGITPLQSLSSGLPAASTGSGFKDINFGLLTNISLTGDLRGGLSFFAIGNYERLLGDFARSPVVRDRNQWFGGVGLAYTF